MKLTEQDVEYLREIFHATSKHIAQMRAAEINIKRADDYGTVTQATPEEARALLGDKRYLGAIKNCALHRTAALPIYDSKQLLFFEMA